MHDGTELDEVSDLLVVGVVFEQNPAGGLGIGVVPQVDVKAGAVAVDLRAMKARVDMVERSSRQLIGIRIPLKRGHGIGRKSANCVMGFWGIWAVLRR